MFVENDNLKTMRTAWLIFEIFQSWLCKFITTARQYFIMANSFMVLMEGVYLHNLMFLNLFSDHSRITIYYSLGWGKL